MQVGNKVKCIDNSNLRNGLSLTLDAEYTVSEVNDKGGIRLQGVSGTFKSSRFRVTSVAASSATSTVMSPLTGGTRMATTKFVVIDDSGNAETFDSNEDVLQFLEDEELDLDSITIIKGRLLNVSAKRSISLSE